MRSALLLVVGLISALSMSPAQAADKADRKQQAADREAMVEQLANKIFTTADRNRNQLLNKREFVEAQSLLDDTLEEWGRTRVIGQPKKANARKKENDLEKGELAAASAKVSSESLAKSNKVTKSEFSIYVQAAVDQADQQWRQINTTADAQAKALAAQRRNMRGSRRQVRTGYPVAPTEY
jgi:hypothetical protein